LQVTFSQVTLTQVTPSQVTLLQVTLTQVTPSQVTPSQVTPTHVTFLQVTPSQVTFLQVTSSQVSREIRREHLTLQTTSEHPKCLFALREQKNIHCLSERKSRKIANNMHAHAIAMRWKKAHVQGRHGTYIVGVDLILWRLVLDPLVLQVQSVVKGVKHNVTPVDAHIVEEDTQRHVSACVGEVTPERTQTPPAPLQETEASLNNNASLGQLAIELLLVVVKVAVVAEWCHHLVGDGKGRIGDRKEAIGHKVCEDVIKARVIRGRAVVGATVTERERERERE
jgi:hypothetical protein